MTNELALQKYRALREITRQNGVQTSDEVLAPPNKHRTG
jgi:hypothetical protein